MASGRQDLLHDRVDVDEGVTKHDFPDTSESVVVLGAGLGGIALLAGLEKVGIPAIILERGSELRQTGNAIGLWPNVFRAMDALGCGGPKFREQFKLNTHVELLSPSGKILKTTELAKAMKSPGPVCEQRAARRHVLQAELASVCKPESFYYGCTVEKVENTPTGALVTLKNGQTLKAKVVVGAEGANSPTAKALGLPPPTYEGYVGIRALAPVSAGLKRGVLKPGTFRLVQGPGVRCGILPLDDEQLYFFITPAAPEDSHIYDPEGIRAEARQALKGWQFPAIDLVEACDMGSIQRSRIFDRWMPPGKAFGKGSITLLGDAVHVSTPNLGQGGCAAIEDAVELTRFLREAVGGEVGSSGAPFRAASKETLEKALRAYECHRSKRTTAIVKKSFYTGYIGQLRFWPLVWLRDFLLPRMEDKDMFDHTGYDCGTV